MKRLVLAVGCLLAAPAFASDFTIENADQSAFHDVSKDIVDAYSYKALEPAEATGITGIAIGTFGTYMSTDESAWKSLTGDSVSGLGMAGVSAHKGLPFGLDVGAYYGYIPQADGGVIGAEARYAIWEGGVVSPAIALRGSYTQSVGIDALKFRTYGTDIAISKGFAFATPYAGVGYVWGNVDGKGDVGSTLGKEDVDAARVFVGLRLSMLLFEVTPEYEHIGSNDIFNLRLGFSF